MSGCDAVPSEGLLPPNKRSRNVHTKPALSTKQAIGAALKELASIEPGSVCCGGQANELPPYARLQVAGCDISFPITSETAAKLHGKGPHGRGRRTVVDTAVRSSREFDADAFAFANPKWEQQLDVLVQRVSTQLGCERKNGRVTAVPYKLLVYAPGDHFQPHRDTEKSPGQFGTLVIHLPSTYEGGALVVKNGKDVHTFDFGASDNTGWEHYYYAAHYADVEHEVQPVTSGYRVMVVYNLVWVGPGVNVPSVNGLSVAGIVTKVANAFQGWDRGDGGLVMIGLEHQYTEAGLSGRGFRGLKGRDGRVANVLEAANEIASQHGRGMAMYITNLTRKYALSNSFPFDDKYDIMEYWFSSKGRKHEFPKRPNGFWLRVPRPNGVYKGPDDIEGGDSDNSDDECERKHIGLEWCEAVPDELSDFWIVARNDITPYTGNEGPTEDRTYASCCIVIWLQGHEPDVLTSHLGFPYCVESLVKARARLGPGPVDAEHLRLAELAVQYWRKEDHTDLRAGNFLELLRYLPSLAAQFIRKLTSMSVKHNPYDRGHSFDLAVTRAIASCLETSGANDEAFVKALCDFVGTFEEYGAHGSSAILKGACNSSPEPSKSVVLQVLTAIAGRYSGGKHSRDSLPSEDLAAAVRVIGWETAAPLIQTILPEVRASEWLALVSSLSLSMELDEDAFNCASVVLRRTCHDPNTFLDDNKLRQSAYDNVYHALIACMAAAGYEETRAMKLSETTVGGDGSVMPAIVTLSTVSIAVSSKPDSSADTSVSESDGCYFTRMLQSLCDAIVGNAMTHPLLLARLSHGLRTAAPKSATAGVTHRVRQAICGTRLRYLESETAGGKPEFSWCQPRATLPQFPDIEAFLRGPEESHALSSAVNGVKYYELYHGNHRWSELKALVAIIKGCRLEDPQMQDAHSYSIERNHNESVTVLKKTRKAYDIEVELYEMFVEERDELRALAELQELDTGTNPAKTNRTRTKKKKSG